MKNPGFRGFGEDGLLKRRFMQAGREGRYPERAGVCGWQGMFHVKQICRSGLHDDLRSPCLVPLSVIVCPLVDGRVVSSSER